MQFWLECRLRCQCAAGITVITSFHVFVKLLITSVMSGFMSICVNQSYTYTKCYLQKRDRNKNKLFLKNNVNKFFFWNTYLCQISIGVKKYQDIKGWSSNLPLQIVKLTIIHTFLCIKWNKNLLNKNNCNIQYCRILKQNLFYTFITFKTITCITLRIKRIHFQRCLHTLCALPIAGIARALSSDAWALPKRYAVARLIKIPLFPLSLSPRPYNTG